MIAHRMRRATLHVLFAALSTVFCAYVQAATIRVEAYIDGRSQLILKGGTAQWQHFDYGAPGYDDNLPTRINGRSWYPEWSGDPRDCNGCYSGIFTGVSPALSAVDQTVTVNAIQAREDWAIVQQPSAGNDYTLILGFDDNSAGGGAWYVLDLDVPNVEPTPVTTQGVPSLGEWGMMLLMAGSHRDRGHVRHAATEDRLGAVRGTPALRTSPE